MPLLAAHKAIVAAYVAALPLAAASLLAACRRSRVPALLAFPLAYNLALHYGFISFALSLPLLLVLLAQVVRLLTAPDGIARRWVATAARRRAGAAVDADDEGSARKVASQPLTRLPSGMPPRNASM